jgi:isopentenyl-diphosphate delta-isomerase
MESATKRRLREELGLQCPLQFLYKFEYQAQFDEAGAEDELCSVYAGRSDETVRADRQEILSWRWIEPRALTAEMSGGDSANFTPWFRLEWRRVWRDHRAALLALQ